MPTILAQIDLLAADINTLFLQLSTAATLEFLYFRVEDVGVYFAHLSLAAFATCL
jgi:hypothetical protein